MIDLGGGGERRVEAVGAGDHHHEILDVDAPAGMGSAAENLDLGQRQAGRAAVEIGDMPPERDAGRGGARVQDRQRRRDGRVAAETRFQRRRVERQDRRVGAGLIGRVQILERGGDTFARSRQSLSDIETLQGRSAVAQIDRLARAA